MRLDVPLPAIVPSRIKVAPVLGRLLTLRWYGIVAATLAYAAWLVIGYVGTTLGWSDVATAAGFGAITPVRVLVLIALASLVWVPIGVWIGLRPAVSQRIQPVAQFLAACPANVLFPFAVVLIVRFDLDPDIWLSPLMVLGTQWYILAEGDPPRDGPDHDLRHPRPGRGARTR